MLDLFSVLIRNHVVHARGSHRQTLRAVAARGRAGSEIASAQGGHEKKGSERVRSRTSSRLRFRPFQARSFPGFFSWLRPSSVRRTKRMIRQTKGTIRFSCYVCIESPTLC